MAWERRGPRPRARGPSRVLLDSLGSRVDATSTYPHHLTRPRSSSVGNDTAFLLHSHLFSQSKYIYKTLDKMSALTKDNVDKLPSGTSGATLPLPTSIVVPDPQHPSALTLMTAVTPGHKTPSLHKPSLSRRSSISAGHGQGAGPLRDVDVSQIGVPVVTPRKERPQHKRSLTGMSVLLLQHHPLAPPRASLACRRPIYRKLTPSTHVLLMAQGLTFRRSLEQPWTASGRLVTRTPGKRL